MSVGPGLCRRDARGPLPAPDVGGAALPPWRLKGRRPEPWALGALSSWTAAPERGLGWWALWAPRTIGEISQPPWRGGWDCGDPLRNQGYPLR
ncbi:hypothetical protein NDU88_002491 [Pleurodeles waltl]|uniref:Uncharacterized protein n=1 Tax=Pleurodeles waltl TaxID=8319 RepID=A0AAV7KZ46_PLEWA|nr:hypothetical protein NDU88_002491 [Pleurodeles waltl]